MNTILKTLIDYSLFEKYNKEYFLNNRIIPIYENDISIKFAVCKSSKLNTIKDDFQKLINFIEIEELELLFILNHIDKKILLYDLSSKSILQNSFEKFIDKFLNELLLFSIKLRASDIHIEQYKDLILFKFRIDGKLKTFFTFKMEFFKFISSFIKLNSNLDMTQCRLPLDGRFSLNIENKKYDFRVSTMPTLEAESIVLRILDNKNIDKNLQTLGLSTNLLEILTQTLKLTQGLILISGPTGSGKTLTSISLASKLLNTNENLNKIFYIFPFNTLVEQTKKVFQNIFKDDFNMEVINSITPIKEISDDENEKEETNYDKSYLNRLFFNEQIIFTTHVKFFDILFGTTKDDNFPLWQLANSVIIIDEIQSYNNNLWWYMTQFFEKFASLLNMKIIIMSATLPKLDFFLEKNIEFPYIIGTSMGALNAASYVSKQKGRSFRIPHTYIKDSRYLSLKNLIKAYSSSCSRIRFNLSKCSFNDLFFSILSFHKNKFEYKYSN